MEPTATLNNNSAPYSLLDHMQVAMLILIHASQLLVNSYISDVGSWTSQMSF